MSEEFFKNFLEHLVNSGTSTWDTPHRRIEKLKGVLLKMLKTPKVKLELIKEELIKEIEKI